MRRRGNREGAAETSQHPFRALFDLMLALVLVLAAVVVAQHRALFPAHAAETTKKTEAHQKATDPIRVVESELLLLHNVARRRADPHSVELYKSLSDLPASDICAQVTPADLTENNKVSGQAGNTISLPASEQLHQLQDHRDRLFVEMEPVLRHQLLGTRVFRVVSQDELKFSSASAVPTDENHLPEILSLIWQRYKEGYRRIRIEGHTDSVAIQTVQFPSNWELSAARAVFLAKALEKDFERRGVMEGPEGVMIEAIGYGERVPIASNATEDGRHRNRRIRIVFEK